MSALPPKIGIGGASRLRPSHTTVRTGPYTAVRKVGLTRFEQGWETERFEVSIGESPTERALLRAIYQGPRPLPAVLLESCPEIRSAISAARRRRGVFHWRQRNVSMTLKHLV